MEITKAFKYGALPPNAYGKIREQLKLGHKYYNKLVEAENLRRKKIWGDEECPMPNHPPKTVINEKTGKKTVKFCHCEECVADWKALRVGFYSYPKLDIKPLRSEASKAGLYWGTYVKVEEAFDAAQKKTKFYDLVKFKSWSKGGIVAVQIQKKHHLSNLYLDNFYKIESLPDNRTGYRKGQRHSIRLRVGTEAGNPILSDPVSFEMHRPLEGIPTWILICLKYSGEREIWSVNVTCKDVPARTDSAINGVVAIDVGWRILKNENLRLAYATGDNGEEYEFVMSPRWRERTDRADRIRSHRDKRLNELVKKDSRFSVLKSPSSVKRYAEKMGYSSDELTEWMKREHHLHEYELGCRRSSFEARRDAMRVWLRNLRRRYAIAIIKDSSHKEMKDHDKAVEDGMYPTSRRNAHHGAPGEIIEEVNKVFGRQTGVAVIEAPWTTASCAVCGAEMIIGAELITNCDQCGASEDRDRVSTRNLLRLYSEGKSKKPNARKQIARFAKRHNKKGQQKECQLNG